MLREQGDAITAICLNEAARGKVFTNTRACLLFLHMKVNTHTDTMKI